MGGSCACCSSDDLIRESKMNVLAMQSPVSVTPDPREGSRTETSTESESPQPPLTGTGSRESKVITSPIAAVNRFENISKEQSVQCLIDISGIVNVYVPRDEFHRWKLSQKILTNLNICAELNVAYVHHKNDPEYKEMKCFSLKNFKNRFKITDIEMDSFKKVVLNALETCTDIYALNLNSSATDNVFLEQILNILVQRHTKGETCPEIIDIENITIQDEGIVSIAKFIEENVTETKWLKIGHCFSYDIPSKLADKLCESMQRNTSLLKMNVQLNWSQNRQRIDGRLRKNNNQYRKRRQQRGL